MDVKRLGLTYVGPMIGSEVKDFLLQDLPDGFVDGFDVAGNVLDGPVVYEGLHWTKKKTCKLKLKTKT